MKIKISRLRNLIRETLQERFGESLIEEEAKEHPGKLITEPEVDEVAPPGGEHVVKALKKQKGIKNPWAVAWSMKKKGAKFHKEGQTGNTDIGLDEKDGTGTGNTNIGLDEMPMDESDCLETDVNQGKKMPGPKVK